MTVQMRAAPPTQAAMTTIAMMVFLESLEEVWAASVVSASVVGEEDGAATEDVTVTRDCDAGSVSVWTGVIVLVEVGGGIEDVDVGIEEEEDDDEEEEDEDEDDEDEDEDEEPGPRRPLVRESRRPPVVV